MSAEVLPGNLKVVPAGFAYAEDPRWRNGRLYFSDMYGANVHAVTPAGAVETVLDLGDGTTSGLAVEAMKVVDPRVG